jgi:hypothetical protein
MRVLIRLLSAAAVLANAHPRCARAAIFGSAVIMPWVAVLGIAALIRVAIGFGVAG